MKSDTELQAWRQQWHSQPLVPMDLISKVERQTADMKLYRFAEYLVTVVMGGGSIVLAAVTRNPTLILLSFGIWVFIALAWVFAIRHTRGLWAPGAPTTAAYIDLSIRRCHWRMADARYDSVQGVLITLFVFLIDYQLLVDVGRWSSPADAWWFWILCAVVLIGVLLAPARKKRKARAELDYLLDLQRQLQE